MRDTTPSWRGRYDIPVGEAQRWTIDALELEIQRLANEWRIVSQRHTVPQATAALGHTFPLGLPPSGAQVDRFLVGDNGTMVHLTPALADRQLVTRPDNPLYLLPGQEVTLYITSPLWTVIEVGQRPQLLWEAPVNRPSDTWLGRPTQEGELCYGGRGQPCLRVADLPSLTHQAITPVVLRNRAQETLHLDRLNIPLPHLSLFEVAGGDLWTQTVNMDLEEDRQSVLVQIDKTPPALLGNATPLRGPRLMADRNLIVRALGALISTTRSEDR